LHIVIYGIILMTNYVTGFQFRKKQANQFCHFTFSKECFLFRGNNAAKRSFWHIIATSLSLCSRSNKHNRTITHSGRENCFHHQTPRKFGESSTQIFEGNREIYKRHNLSSLRIYSWWWIDKWRIKVALIILKWNIATTDWEIENSLKFTKRYYRSDSHARNTYLIKQ